MKENKRTVRDGAEDAGFRKKNGFQLKKTGGTGLLRGTAWAGTLTGQKGEEKMHTSLGKKLVVLFVTFLLAVSPLSGVLAEEYAAQTMRLLRYEGDIVIEDTKGNPRFVMENVRFKSGEAVSTGEKSTVSVSLDDTKIVSLDQNTRVEFFKNGSQLRLKLTAGAILLDVRKKLDENESLDVETSTMTVGITGTVIKIDQQEMDIDGLYVCKVTLLEGTSTIEYTDEYGNKVSVTLSAGYTAVLTDLDGDGVLDSQPEVRRTEEADTEGFVEELIAQDPELRWRVEAVREQQNAGNGGNQPVGSPVSAPTTN